MTIGERIKEIRQEKNMTQKELGEKCGLADSAIRRYELGKANPKKETIQKIANALNIDPFSLYSFEMATKVLEESINAKEQELFESYNQLNTAGQEKAVEQVKLLTKIPEYQQDRTEGQ